MTAAPLLVALAGADHLAAGIAQGCGAEMAVVAQRSFPDGESYFRVDTEVRGRDVVLLACLDTADARILPALIAASTLRELGAARVTLVAPYMPYMRQDQRFRSGEALSARVVARLLSTEVDRVITVDPHEHRIGSIGEIFSVPTTVVSAAPAIAQWVRAHVEEPTIVGPDSESEQWVSAVSRSLGGVPELVLEKVRHGDRDVEVTGAHGAVIQGTPVLVDDIISSGMTIVNAAAELADHGAATPVCVAVHGLFDAQGLAAVRSCCRELVTVNTVLHATNGIDVAPLLAAAIREQLT